MKVKLLLIGFLAFWGSVEVKAQSELRGKVLSEDGVELNKVLIINMKTGHKLYANSEGMFKILTNEAEEIRIIRDGYHRISYIVKSSDFEREILFKMKKSETLIDEVVITKVSKDKLDKLNQDLGIPNVKKGTASRPKPAEWKDVLGSVLFLNPDLNAIQDLITGDARRRETLYKYEYFQESVVWIKDRIDPNFFVEKGIPEERISEFIGFAITEKTEIKTHIKTRNIIGIQNLLEKVLPIYLKRLNEKK